MSEWKKVKIGDFLHQYRNTIYVEDAEIYRQITISSKDGIKYRCSKIGKEIGRKRQFVIDLKKNPNTVIFTRQGLHEGSIGIAPLEVDECITTENMPMFSIDESMVLSDYLRLFFKSPIFINLIGTLTPTGSAQKAIHERDLLPLEILLPDLATQKELVKNLSHQLKKSEDLQQEIEKQKSYAKQLRQNILQDAIEGKLTEEWRKNHPVVKGNPDFDAEALFEKIQEENGYKISKIDKTEYGWCFSILGNFVKLKIGGTPSRNNPDYWKKEIPWVSSGEVANCEIYSTKEQISLTGSEKSAAKILPKGTVLIAMIGQGKTRGQSAILRIEAATNQNVCAVLLPNKLIKSEYMYIYFCSRYEESRKVATGGNQAALSGTKISQFLFSLPPLAEQEEIVRVVEAQLAKVDQLEKQIAERETLTKRLMQSIMKDAFREG